MSESNANPEEITTPDGIPLKVALRRTLRHRKRTALLLVAPLFVFILVTFLFPIFDMLSRSVDNKIMHQVLPQTTVLLAKWDDSTGELPNEAIFKTFVLEAQVAAKEKTINKVGKRLNYDKSGMSSLFRKTGRKLQRFDPDKLKTNYTDLVLGIDKKWKDILVWQLFKRESGKYTPSYYYAAVDAQMTADGLHSKAENKQIYMKLFYRTLY
ncbi:MAG: ABC transporter permease, partial [Gammaproteobacteria bacterium]